MEVRKLSLSFRKHVPYIFYSVLRALKSETCGEQGNNSGHFIRLLFHCFLV